VGRSSIEVTSRIVLTASHQMEVLRLLGVNEADLLLTL
jgi:hypothetical protein